MHEHVDRRVRHLRREDIEPLDRGRTIGEALGRPQALAHQLAVADTALQHRLDVGRVDCLVVGLVEVLLVHIAPDQRALGARRLLRPLRQRGRGGSEHRAGGSAGQERAAGQVVVRMHGVHAIMPKPRGASARARPGRAGHRDCPASPASRSDCSPPRRSARPAFQPPSPPRGNRGSGAETRGSRRCRAPGSAACAGGRCDAAR